MVVVAHADREVAFGHTIPIVQRATMSTGGSRLGFGWGAGGWTTTGMSDGDPSGKSSDGAVPSASEPSTGSAAHGMQADARVWNPQRTSQYSTEMNM